MYNFLSQTVLIFPIFTKVTETFWSREVTDRFKYFLIYTLGHLPQKSQTRKEFWTISSLHVQISRQND